MGDDDEVLGLMALARRAVEARHEFERRAWLWGVTAINAHPVKPGRFLMLRVNRRPMPETVRMLISASFDSWRRAQQEFDEAVRRRH